MKVASKVVIQDKDGYFVRDFTIWPDNIHQYKLEAWDTTIYVDSLKRDELVMMGCMKENDKLIIEYENE